MYFLKFDSYVEHVKSYYYCSTNYLLKKKHSYTFLCFIHIILFYINTILINIVININTFTFILILCIYIYCCTFNQENFPSLYHVLSAFIFSISYRHREYNIGKQTAYNHRYTTRVISFV